MERLIYLILIIGALVIIFLPKQATHNRCQDDEEQLEYLRKWREKHK